MAHSKFDVVNGKRVKCYDNGGQTADRYTVAYLDAPTNPAFDCPCVGMSAEPFHPQGIAQHGDCQLGKHLGNRIAFVSLPADCRKVVEQDCA